MIITISGTTASGKDTTAELLSKKLGIKLIRATMKDFAKDLGIDILEFEKTMASKSDEWDKKLDEWQKNLPKKYKDFILVSRMGALNIPQADLKIFIDASIDERAKRIAERDNIDSSKAKEYLIARDEEFRQRIKRIYGVDPYDMKHYDVKIDTTNMTPEEVVEAIIKELEIRGLL